MEVRLLLYLQCDHMLTHHTGGFFRARLTFPTEYPLLPPKMRFETPIFHPNSEFPIHLLLCFFNQPTPQSIRTEMSVFRSCTPQKKTNTVMNPPLSAGHPSKPPKPFFSPSYPCSPAPTTSRLRTSRLPACGETTHPSLRSA